MERALVLDQNWRSYVGYYQVLWSVQILSNFDCYFDNCAWDKTVAFSEANSHNAPVFSSCRYHCITMCAV